MDMNKLINDPNTILIDVRTPMEYADQHVDGSLNIPLDTIEERAAEIKNMGKPIVLFCRSGARSGQALMYLQHFGVENIYNAGGIANVMLHKMN